MWEKTAENPVHGEEKPVCDFTASQKHFAGFRQACLTVNNQEKTS